MPASALWQERERMTNQKLEDPGRGPGSSAPVVAGTPVEPARVERVDDCLRLAGQRLQGQSLSSFGGRRERRHQPHGRVRHGAEFL
eukprot:7264408-Prymnesium_polylepis.1